MGDTARMVRELTGAHTRIVWAQQQEGFADMAMIQPDFKLMGLDTDDGKGVHAVADEIASYCTPVFTPNGDRVIYTNNVDKTVYICDWDGGNRRALTEGFAVSVWKDPETQAEWVLVKPNNAKSWNSKSRPVVRHMIDDPKVKETVWDSSNVAWNWFQLSLDGTRAAVCAPWPQCGIATIESKELKEIDRGCWTAFVPDNSMRMWVFDGDHRTVKLWDKTGKFMCRIDLHQVPGNKGWEIYHPRWSNHIRYVNVTGPYNDNRTDACDRPDDFQNYTGTCGYNVELYLGRLAPWLTGVEEWVQITDNEKADFGGDAWIDLAERNA